MDAQANAATITKAPDTAKIKEAIRFVCNIPKNVVTWHRMRRLKKQTDLARKYLNSLDMTLSAMNMNRQQKRQFWRDFTKYPGMRDRFFEAGTVK
jgi:hypothetical protein